MKIIVVVPQSDGWRASLKDRPEIGYWGETIIEAVGGLICYNTTVQNELGIKVGDETPAAERR